MPVTKITANGTYQIKSGAGTNRQDQIKQLEAIYDAFNHRPLGEGPSAKVVIPRKSIPIVLALIASEIAVQRKCGLLDKE